MEDLRYEYPTLTRYFRVLGIGQKDIEGMRVLDVGAGALRFAQEAAYAFGAEIYSCEPDLEEARTYYRRIADAQSMGGLLPKLKQSWELALSRTYEGSVETLPYEDAMFGLVMSCYALPGLLQNEAAMQKGLLELWRVTAPGGRIIMAPMLFSRTSIEEGIRILEGLRRFHNSLPRDTDWRVTEYVDADAVTGTQITLMRLFVGKS